MNRRASSAGLSALVFALATIAVSPAGAQQYYGGSQGGMMGQGMMGPGMMMGQGFMMCPLSGPGMGWGYGRQANLNLSVDDVKRDLERGLAMMGNSHPKAGPVTEKDANVITADVVTTDKEGLVQRFTVDRRTGSWQPMP